MADYLTGYFATRYTVEDTGCWHWKLAPYHTTGYGQISPTAQRLSGKVAAHTLSYVIHKGEYAPHLLIRHTCDNRICVNPDHLLVGTHKDNAQDKMQRGRWGGPTKLDQPRADAIRALYKADVPAKVIAAAFGITDSYVYRIGKGMFW